MAAGIAAGAALLVAVVAVVVLGIVARRATRALCVAEEQIRRLRASAEAELEAAGRDAGERLDRAVVRAEAAVTAAETASRIADAALTAPVVKARAWGAGTAAAARTLRERRALRAGSD
jgi:hypothetical protein